MSNAVPAILNPIKSLILGSPTPALPPAPPPPSTDTSFARKKAREAERGRKGRKSTILSGGAGVTGGTPLSQPQALGA